jgi:hypothetical protein
VHAWVHTSALLGVCASMNTHTYINARMLVNIPIHVHPQQYIQQEIVEGEQGKSRGSNSSSFSTEGRVSPPIASREALASAEGAHALATALWSLAKMGWVPPLAWMEEVRACVYVCVCGCAMCACVVMSHNLCVWKCDCAFLCSALVCARETARSLINVQTVFNA